MPTVPAPACGIDWSRDHTLPFGVPPEVLTDAARVQYARALAASADLPRSTYGRYFDHPKHVDVRRTTSGHVLPRHSAAAAVDATLPAAAVNAVRTNKFNPREPDPGTPEQVEAQLQGRIAHDGYSVRFAPLPIPLLDLDTFRLYCGPVGVPSFAGTLGLDLPGVLPADGTLPNTAPTTLLATRQIGQQVVYGELDRLLLRAPVTGRFRFEPYGIYRFPTATTLEAVGPSNSGRLLVEQPNLSLRKPEVKTDTKVFGERVFAFEHVDRTAVASLMYHVLVFQLAFVEQVDRATERAAGVEPRLAIRKNTPKVRDWLLEAVNTMLRSWTAYLAVLRWRPQDIAVATALPPAWFGGFTPAKANAKEILPAVRELLTHDDWVESLLFFAENVMARKLAGYSWTEILDVNGQDPTVKRFPVPSDRPPYTPKDDAAIKQHQRLRLLEDPKLRWLACYAGCPIGKPSQVYAPAPAPGMPPTFPPGGLTTYELEVLHLAGTAHTELGLAAPVAGQGPRPGRAMDPAPYHAKAAGHACFFGAERAGDDLLYTAVDWLLELTRGIHFNEAEAAFVELFALRDPDTGQGHPLLAPLRADEHDRARNLRRQMDALLPPNLGPTSLTWWDSKLGFTKASGKWEFLDPRNPIQKHTVKPAPEQPYDDQRTSRAFARTVLKFDDLLFGAKSGFDAFDIESAYQATERMRKPLGSGDRLPIAVLLALMETEGIKQFGPINRYARNSTSQSSTMRWEARRDLVPPLGPEPQPAALYALRSDGSVIPSEMARKAWLSYPYGLDTFAEKSASSTDARVQDTVVKSNAAALDPAESVGRYIRDRVHGVWKPVPPPAAAGPDHGLPVIWKRSRRVHWALLSLMVAYYRHLEIELRTPTKENGFEDPDPNDRWKPNLSVWLPAGQSPPDLTSKGPADTEWKDYITYYAMLYPAYNAGPAVLRAFLRGAESARPSASPLSHRDFFLFKHSRRNEVMGNMARFAIALDAFMRLDYMENKAPKDYTSAAPQTAAPSTRAWGV